MQFPEFALPVKAEYRNDGSLKAGFAAAVDSIVVDGKRRFQQFGAEVQSVLSKATASGFHGGQFKVDLDLGGFRQAAAEARLSTRQLTAMRDAAVSLARSTGDTSTETRAYVQALHGQAIEAERAQRAAETQVTAYTRLQTEIDRTVASQTRLAQAYRDTFLEQARSTNAAHAAQQIVNAQVAPGLTRVAGRDFSRASDSADVFQNFGYKAAADMRSFVDRIRDGDAALDRAAVSATTLDQVLGRVATKGPQVSAALEGAQQAAARAADEQAAAQSRVAASQQQLVNSTTQLRSQLDPLYAAQQRITTQMDLLDRALEAGAIDMRTYGQLTGAAADQFELYAAGARSGTAATKNVINAQGAQRIGMQQLSFQLNDIATMYAMGARPMQIFASQSGQVVQAVSLMTGGTSKFANFMMGPWGTAITVGTLVLVPLISKLFDTTEATKAAEEAGKALADRQLDIANFFDRSTGKIKENSAALIENAKAQIYARTLEIEKEQLERKSKIGDIVSSSRERQVIGFDESIQPTTGDVIRTPIYSKPNSDLVDILRKNRGDNDSIYAAVSKLARSQSPAADEARQLSDLFAQSALGAKQARELEAKLKSLETGTLDRSLLTPKTPRRSHTKDEANEAEKLAKVAESASEKIARITEEFDRQPRAIDRARQASRQLDQVYADLEKRHLLNPDVVDQIGKARAAIEDFSTRPFQEMVQAGREELEIQRLTLEGRGVEAETLDRALSLQRKQGEVTTDQLASIRAMVLAQRQMSAELEKQNALRQVEAQFIENTSNNLRQSFHGVASGGGVGSIGQMFKRQFDLVRGKAIDSLFDSLFGDTFTSAKDKALGFDKVREASVDQAEAAASLTDALRKLDDAASSAATSLASRGIVGAAAGTPATLEDLFDRQFASRIPVAARVNGVDTAAANDNPTSPITVYARSPREFTGDVVAKVADIFLDEDTAKKIGEGISDGISGNHGAAYGMMASGLILGSGGSPLGSALGGGIGEKLLTKPLEKGLESIASGLGKFAGPLAGIAGGLLGGVVGSLFSSTPRASATIGGTGNTLEVVSVQGNKRTLREASNKTATEAIGTLDQIAEALGATINASAGSVSIGYRKGNARVDPTGTGQTRLKRGAVDFGEDTQSAIKYATMDLIKDGVLEGLRASTQRILQQSSDLDTAIKKAVDFESVFTRLKEYRDPVGAALDTLDKEFGRLGTIFKEAGATTAEYSDLEALYAIERKNAVEDARQRITGSLQDLLDNLTIGDSGLSLRARMQAAQDVYTPLASRVRAGDVTAYDDYATASQTLLDISRQLYGSQSGYFDVFDQVKSITQSALDKTNAIAEASANRDSPFSTSSAVPAQDNTAVVSAIEAMNSNISATLASYLGAVNKNLGTLIEAQAASNSNTSPSLLAVGAGWVG